MAYKTSRGFKTLMLFFVLLALPLHSAYAQNISVFMDKTPVVFNTATGYPYLDEHSRTLVPFRAVMEAYGCNIEWDQVQRVATAQKDGITVTVPMSKAYILVNGIWKANASSARVVNGRTYLPIRTVLEAFGASVSWNVGLNAVVVESPLVLEREKAVVTFVIDGDTVVLDSGDKVRFTGVDTPEVRGPYTKAEVYGEEASAYTKRLLTGKTVYMEKDISDRDKYGRLLRYVYLADGTFVNLRLVEEGYARAVVYPPDEKYAEALAQAEKNAQKSLKGLWSKQ